MCGRMGVCICMRRDLHLDVVCVCVHACVLCAIRSPINESRMFLFYQPVQRATQSRTPCPYTVYLSVAIKSHARCVRACVRPITTLENIPLFTTSSLSSGDCAHHQLTVSLLSFSPTLAIDPPHLPAASSNRFYQISLKSAIIAVLEALALRVSLSIIHPPQSRKGAS